MNYKFCSNEKCGEKHWQDGILCRGCLDEKLGKLCPPLSIGGCVPTSAYLTAGDGQPKYNPNKRAIEIRKANHRKAEYAAELRDFGKPEYSPKQKFKHTFGKWSEDDKERIVQMRKMRRTAVEIAAMYGVTHGHILELCRKWELK